MAHANLHMAVGLAVGTALTLLPVARAVVAGRPLARPVGRLLLAGYAVGIWALVPNLLTSAGAPASIHHAWWSNVFVLHAAIDHRKDGGLLIGELLLVAGFVFQYVLVIFAIVRARRRANGS
ncbi:MAG TPA: hypothetical protein VM734_06120 [Kofleriaceae bacterium]|nr:hypothetical protein [Kofleriaceae bacterium]